jgi:hypothetical protein
LLVLLFLFASCAASCAGELQGSEECKTVALIKLEEPWTFRTGLPGFLALTSGEVGYRNRSADVNVYPDTVLRHLDMTASLSVDARKGWFGISASFFYLEDSASQSYGGLVANTNLVFNQLVTDFELTGRIVDTPRGWIELRGGFRYINIYNNIGLSPNSREINQASEEFVNVASDEVNRLLNSDLKGALEEGRPVLAVPPLAARDKLVLLSTIKRLKTDPDLRRAIQSGDPAQIAAEKRRIQSDIARELKQRLSRSFTLDEDWFDPFIGFGSRLNLSKAFYLTGKADIGGFGVGSNLTVQAYGALGCQVTRNIWSEIGYKLLWADYRANSFVYNVTTSGIELTAGINF